MPQGYVISQSEVPGTEVKEGSQIVVDVSKGQDPSKTEPPTKPPTEATEPPTTVEEP